MYRMLIVDDEIHVVEGLKSDFDFAKNDISQVYVAYNIRQAKEIFVTHTIDIMLCDIEMPQGSGLDLLAWVKERYPQTEVIFLTNHADFKYAKQALHLGSLEYLLKPVPVDEFEHVLGKAKDKISQNQESRQYHQLWSKHQSVIVERFWLDLIHRTIPSHVSAIKETIQQRNLPYTDNMTYIPILVSVQNWSKSFDLRDKKIIEYALKNSAEEMIVDVRSKHVIIPLDTGVLLIILAFEEVPKDEPQLLLKACETYIESCCRYFYCDLSCYIGSSAPLPEVVVMVERLTSLDKDNVAFVNKAFLLNTEITSVGQIQLPEMYSWLVMLKNGSKQTVISEVTMFLEELVHKEGLNAGVLREFHQNFLQLIHFVLNVKGIQAYQLFCDPKSTELSVKATRSVADLLAWVVHSVEKAMFQALQVEKTNNVVESVKQYIALQLDNSELSRDEIASHAFLNPDYLSRMFKKETGIPISDYLIQERLKLAQQLLAKTEMPVGNIADAVGYLNFSHFSKMFKKHTNVNPLEYRQQIQGKNRT